MLKRNGGLRFSPSDLNIFFESRFASFMDRPYPLTEVPAAVRHLATGKAAGKVVITV